jgi:MYXO-CTERM domain-containing protein
VDLGGLPEPDLGVDGGRRTVPRRETAGCGCTVPTESPAPAGLFWALGLLGILAWRRRGQR